MKDHVEVAISDAHASFEGGTDRGTLETPGISLAEDTVLLRLKFLSCRPEFDGRRSLIEWLHVAFPLREPCGPPSDVMRQDQSRRDYRLRPSTALCSGAWKRLPVRPCRKAPQFSTEESEAATRERRGQSGGMKNPFLRTWE